MKESFYVPRPRTHLDLTVPGNKPIFASLLSRFDRYGDAGFTRESYRKLQEVLEKIRSVPKDRIHVVPHADEENLAEQGFLQTEFALNIISPLDDKDKYFPGYVRCTSLIVAGIDKATRKNISFVTHQYPDSFLGKDKEEFTELLRQRLAEARERCVPGTIDAVIVGGYYDHSDEEEEKTYTDSINFFSGEVEENLQFKPTVANGPKIVGGIDDIFFENEERRLYFMRQEINENGADFPADDFEKVKDKYDPGEEKLIRELKELRERVHKEMEIEIRKRLETDPDPTEEELRAAAFKEWIEPQVRDAVAEMNRKGYATMSSGFYGGDNSYQAIDGYFVIDDEAKAAIEALGAEVLDGAGIGVPLNKAIRQIRFRPKSADMNSMKQKWDAIAAVLPERREGPRAICDRAEEFREQYAPDHPSFEEERERYMDFVRANNE